MGFLTVFSTSALSPLGHTGVILQYENGMGTEWLGFALDTGQLLTPDFWELAPLARLEAGVDGGPGTVYNARMPDRVARYVRIRLDDQIMVRAKNNVICQYIAENYYHLFYRDCVSFARDMAKECGLNAPSVAIVPPMLPYYINRDNQDRNPEYEAVVWSKFRYGS